MAVLLWWIGIMGYGVMVVHWGYVGVLWSWFGGVLVL